MKIFNPPSLPGQKRLEPDPRLGESVIDAQFRELTSKPAPLAVVNHVRGGNYVPPPPPESFVTDLTHVTKG